MRKAILGAIIVAIAGAAGVSHAQPPWSGKSEAGAVLAKGNSETQSGNLKFDVAHEIDRWKLALGLAALIAGDELRTTAERYEGRIQSDWKMTEKSYWFGALRYEDDHFTGFHYQATATTGLGRKFIDTETTKLDGQVGVGYRRLKTVSTGELDSSAVARADVNYEQQLTDTTLLIDRFLVEGGPDNTFLQNELSLQVKVTASLALVVGIAVRHNTGPPAGLEKTDTVSTVNLVHSF